MREVPLYNKYRRSFDGHRQRSFWARYPQIWGPRNLRNPSSGTGVPRSLMRTPAPPMTTIGPRALGIGLLKGPRVVRFLMGEVPLYLTTASAHFLSSLPVKLAHQVEMPCHMSCRDNKSPISQTSTAPSTRRLDIESLLDQTFTGVPRS